MSQTVAGKQQKFLRYSNEMFPLEMLKSLLMSVGQEILLDREMRKLDDTLFNCQQTLKCRIKSASNCLLIHSQDLNTHQNFPWIKIPFCGVKNRTFF